MKTISRRLTLTLALAGSLAASVAALAIAADSELIVFDWSGYEDPSFHQKYLDKNGDSPTFAFFGDEDEAFEKIRSGFKADLGHPCSQSVVKWREAGLLQPLDTSKITDWNSLNPGIMAMKDLATTADGKAWFMPWDWGNTLVTYNTEKVDEKDVQSLKAFADPKFEGRVSIRMFVGRRSRWTSPSECASPSASHRPRMIASARGQGRGADARMICSSGMPVTSSIAMNSAPSGS